MVQALEAHLKVRLLNRNTRNVTLTDEGRAYYERCARVLSEIDEMEAMAAGSRQGPGGRLKVSLPASSTTPTLTLRAAWPAVRSGLLRQILRDYAAPPQPVSIVFSPNRPMPQRLRAFIDWFAALYQSLSEQA